MDFFADNMVKRIIGEIIQNKGEIKTNEQIWYQMTKCMIRQKNAFYVINQIEQIIEELSDADWFENKYPPEIFKEKPIKKQFFKTNSKLLNHINTHYKISDVAKKYGLVVDKKGLTQCPFHDDSEPSMKLNDKKNIFYCFGCHKKGDIITFIRKLEEEKEGVKKRSRTEGN